MDWAIRVLPLALCFARAVVGDARTSKLNAPFVSHGHKTPQLIAFNTNGGDIDVSMIRVHSL